VCSNISVGDDRIAIEGAPGVTSLTIRPTTSAPATACRSAARSTAAFVGLNVYDLSIDGLGSGLGGGSSTHSDQIRSQPRRSGHQRQLHRCLHAQPRQPIILTPMYGALTGTLIPTYNGITIRNFRSVASTVVPNLTLLAFDASHVTGVTLDNVVIDGLTAAHISASNTNVTLGPGDVNVMPTGTGVTVTNDISGTSTPNPCGADRFPTF
jgi:hypothetical protein